MANIDSNELSVKDFMQSLMSGLLSDDIIESYVLALNEKGLTSENIYDAAPECRSTTSRVAQSADPEASTSEAAMLTANSKDSSV